MRSVMKGKYPEDVTYEEMGLNARVFRTHLDESAIFDANMIEESRDSVDVLLVFMHYPSCDSLHANSFYS